MQIKKIYDNDGKGFTRVFSSGDFEYVNPIEHYGNHEINKIMILRREDLELRNPFLASITSNDYFYKIAVEHWGKMYKEINDTPIPENFIKLFSASSKKEQVKLLRNQSLTVFQLGALLFKAHELGYSFSQYTGEHHHNGVDEDNLPLLIHVEDDGKVKTVGETSLSDSKLKQIIEHRKVTISKFLDNGSHWHCFFLTFKSLRGEESWKDGQAHLHYISDKWGLKREDLVTKLKSKDNSISSKVHIDLLDY
jgi:hypothetical protein